MKKLHRISGIVIMLFAALICFEASTLSFGTPKSPGPGLLPMGCGILLLLVGAIFIAKAGSNKGKSSDPAGSLWHGLQWKRVICTILFLAAYALLLERLGYLITTWMLMIYLFWGDGLRQRSMAVFGALAVSIVSYVLFKVLLSVRLPSGMFGI